MFGLVLAPPSLLGNAVVTALTKLGLGARSALGVALGIFVGGAVNVSVARIEQAELVEYQPTRLLGLHRLLGRPVRRRAYTVIAVNVGGCLVPTALAGYQIGRIALQAPSTLRALGTALVLNVGLCYSFATPVPGQGIAMQPLIPAGAAALSGLVLAPAWAPPIAFAAGVLVPRAPGAGRAHGDGDDSQRASWHVHALQERRRV